MTLIGHRGERSYNTTGLLSLFAAQTGSLASALAYLLNNNVISIEWHWSKLKKQLRLDGLSIRISEKEIEDGDPDYDIGEYFVDGYPTYKPVEK